MKLEITSWITPEQAAVIAAAEAADAAERAAAVAATQAAYPGGKLTDGAGRPVMIREVKGESHLSRWADTDSAYEGGGGVIARYVEYVDGSPANGHFVDGTGAEWVRSTWAANCGCLVVAGTTATSGWLPANARPTPEQTYDQAEKAWSEIDAAKEQKALLAQVAALPADAQDRLAYEVEAYTADRWAKIDSGRRKVYAVDTLRAAVEQHAKEAAEKAAAKQAVRSASPFAALAALKMAA